MTDEVLLNVADGIARVTLNRPAAGNAIDLPTARALVDIAKQCQGDDTIGCVVLTGSGRIFCAGGDLATLTQAGDRIDEVLAELAGTLHNAVIRFATMAKPMVVLVNGPAAGAGLSLALAGDVVLCTHSTHFTAAYGKLGLTPDGGMSWLLPRLVGMRRAQEIILTDRRILAEEAAHIGMVTRLVAAEALLDSGMEVARTLRGASGVAIQGVRALLGSSFQNSLPEQLDAEARTIVAASRSDHAKHRMATMSGRQNS